MHRLSKISFLFAALSLVSMALIRYMVGEWVPFCWVALGLFVFFACFGVFMDRKLLIEFFTLKTTKYGMNMGALILLVLALIIVVNFIAVRKYTTFDFSLSKSNTLSEQSIKLLKSLDSDLRILFFYKKGVEGNEENRRMFRDLVKKYQDQTDKVRLDFIEVNERPDVAKDFGVDKGSGVVFLEYKGRRNRIDKIEEQDMSSALVKVTREKKKTIYFTTGHGEKNLEEAKEAQGINALKILLENNSYTVKTLALSQNPKVPEDADLLVIAGARQGFLDFELAALEDYLKKGGSLFLALRSQESESLAKLLAMLGLELQNNYIWSIVETPMGRGLNQGPVLGAVFSPTSEIVRSFGRDEVTLFIHPSALKHSANPPKTMTIDDVVSTSASAVAYRTLEVKGDGSPGPFILVSSVKGRFPGANEKEGDKAKDFSVVVAGDSDFLNNQLLFKNLNRDLVLNSVASLVKEENLISISPKETQKTDLMLTQVKFAFFIFGFIIPLPLLMLASSVALWLRRRNA